ncbi:MAG TPA: phosphotransferase [Pyrinomonadaceae bacterium]|nr:phosphotransferase [Pyrinomonadaceae bacterium]
MRVELYQYDRLKETQTSRLYFKGDLVYKVKKSVADNFISYLTRQERRAAIEREFNRSVKYSPRLYREMVDVLEPAVPEPEPAICMNYLGPHYTTLFSHLRRSPLRAGTLGRLLDEIKAFHGRTRVYTKPDEVPSAGMERRFRLLLDEAESLGVRMQPGFIEGCEKFLSRYQAEYAVRMERGLIRELHGDLHTDNILFNGDDFIFFDFLDFEESFTTGDIGVDLGFLISDFCSREEINDPARLLSSVDSRFNVGAETLVPLAALGLLNRANTFRLRADCQDMSDASYRLSESMMERYLKEF